MSINAPWLALACDWYESEMFEGTTAGQKLAFIALLCFAKTRGRAGAFTLRPDKLCQEFTINRNDLDVMLRRAIDHGCIEVDINRVSFKNWRQYQDPTKRRSSPVLLKHTVFSKNTQTKDQSPSTKDQSPSTKNNTKSARMVHPSHEQCCEFGNSISLSAVQCGLFFNHYESNGWKVGPNPMKRWEAAMRKWKGNHEKYDNGQTTRRADRRADKAAGECSEKDAPTARHL
jgi:hypothetical protein